MRTISAISNVRAITLLHGDTWLREKCRASRMPTNSTRVANTKRCDLRRECGDIQYAVMGSSASRLAAIPENGLVLRIPPFSCSPNDSQYPYRIINSTT